IALVALGDVRPVSRGEGPWHGADETVEVLENKVDLHTRVRLLELLAELLQHRLQTRVLVVVRPHRELGRTRLGPVGGAHRDHCDEYDARETEHDCDTPLHLASLTLLEVADRRRGNDYRTVAEEIRPGRGQCL